MIDIPVGQEGIMGSTRMKSASAQKMVCNEIAGYSNGINKKPCLYSTKLIKEKSEKIKKVNR